jgi:hypothetical protein
MGYVQILRRYYGPVAVVAGGGGGGSSSAETNDSRPAGSAGHANSPDPKAKNADTHTTGRPDSPTKNVDSASSNTDTQANNSGTPALTTTPDVPTITCEAGLSGGVGMDVESSASDAMPIGQLAFTQG